MKRTIRRILEIALPVSGMGVIFLSVLFGSDSLQRQVLFVLFGILILEAGAWNLASRLLSRPLVLGVGKDVIEKQTPIELR